MAFFLIPNPDAVELPALLRRPLTPGAKSANHWRWITSVTAGRDVCTAQKKQAVLTAKSIK